MSGSEYRQNRMPSFDGNGWLGQTRFSGQQHAVSAMLRESFDGIAAEPLPAPIVDLLRRLGSERDGEVNAASAGTSDVPQ